MLARQNGHRTIRITAGTLVPVLTATRYPILSDGLRDMILEHIAATYGKRVPKGAPLFPYGRGGRHGKFMAP